MNVGGNNKLPMKDLSTILEHHNCVNIQSGNVAFGHKVDSPDELAKDVAKTIAKIFYHFKVV